MLCWFTESDVQFFSVCSGIVISSITFADDAHRTEPLARDGQQRSVLPSEYNREEIEADHHVYATKKALYTMTTIKKSPRTDPSNHVDDVAPRAPRMSGSRIAAALHSRSR